MVSLRWLRVISSEILCRVVWHNFSHDGGVIILRKAEEILVSWGGVWHWVHLVRLPLTGLLCQPHMIDGDDECGAVGGMRTVRRNRNTRRIYVPLPLCPPQIPHDLTRARTRATAVGSRWLTAWAMARPKRGVTESLLCLFLYEGKLCRKQLSCVCKNSICHSSNFIILLKIHRDFQNFFNSLHFGVSDERRSQWPRGLRHVLSSLARKLGSWVRIQLEAWKSLLCAFILCLCCSMCR
jgi:hypothetical protein